MPVVDRAIAAATHVANSGVPDDAMWLVDLRGAASVAFGSTLSQRTALPLAVVPTFNNWPGDDEVIPAEETLAAMVSMPPRKPSPDELAARPVFLLDAWRLAFRNDEIDEDAYDNRYYLNPSDLPSVERLVEQGIHRLIYVVEDLGAVTNEEDDLHAALLAYQEAGITIHFVDLAWLSGYPPQQSFIETWMPRRIQLIHRPTIIHDPHFFLRARGGFGGIHATPGSGHLRYTPNHHYHYHGWYRGGG
jgi:hypothetical protein